jgi:hypothetical protein
VTVTELSSWTPPPASCVRRAWLTLGSKSIELDNPSGGWFCTSLDLGAPSVRDVLYNAPDQDGQIDLTNYLGGRVVTASITALVGAGAQIDAVAAAFAPFMVPSARPVLHFILDRPGAAERVLTVRGASGGYSWPIIGANQRDIALQWVAADPIVRDPAWHTIMAWSGAVASGGRTYPLTFNRVYPGGGGAVVNANLQSPGDVAVVPLLQVYGPISGPRVNFTDQVSGEAWTLNFVSAFRIDQGHRVDIDCAARTAYLDGDITQSVLGSLDWASVRAGWPVLPPLPNWQVLHLAGSSTSNVTQCVASWQDGYLS